MKVFKLIPILLFIVTSHLSISQMVITSESFDNIQANERPDVNLRMANSYEVLNISVDALIKEQIAEVSVTQTIYNPGNRSMEVEIYFPLPNNGIVQNFVMMVNGKEIPGELLKKEEARSIYEGIVRRKKDPAIMEYVGYGLFKTSVFPIQVNEEREISVRYTQVLDRNDGQIGFSYPFGTQKFSARALKKVSFKAKVVSQEEIKTVFCPTHDLQVKKNGNNEMTLSFEKTMTIPKNDLKVNWSTNSGKFGHSLVSYKETGKDGYFMLLISPEISKSLVPPKKQILFVLDKSGSMHGKKLEQSKKALEFVVNNLNAGDQFNIIVYDDRVDKFKSDLVEFSESTKVDALEFIGRIESGGGTNISGSLVESMQQFSKSALPKYMIFLTDGLPTAGERNESKISTLVKTANENNAKVFCFGVGNDVNARLLDRISLANGGFTEYVKPSEDIELSVSKLFKGISDPAMTDIKLEYSGVEVSQTYPTVIPDVFKGGQLMLVGKYRKEGKGILKFSGTVNGRRTETEFKLNFSNEKNALLNNYVEKVWAAKRVGYLINEIDLNGESSEMINELVSLSKKYGILTPYTAFLAREDLEVNNQAQHIEESRKNLKGLEQIEGGFANHQRAFKNDLMKKEMPISSNEEIEILDQSGDVSIAKTIQNINGNTFYLQKGTWIQSDLTEQEQTNALVVKKFSDGYFKLSKGNEATLNKYLSVDKNILVRIEGQIYNIVQ